LSPYFNAPAGQAIPLRALWRATQLAAELPWSACTARYFDSGTSALAAAIRAARRSLLPGVTNVRVLLPAYACPNLHAAALAAGAQPEYLDLEPGQLAPADATLLAHLRRGDSLAICVDMFGAPVNRRLLVDADASVRPRVIHDLAQSFAPYLPGWQPEFPHTVVSFGRAKPMSLTRGGALLTPSPPPVDRVALAVGKLDAIRLMLRSSIYNACLHPIAYGLLRTLPATGVGSTRFAPLGRIHELGPEFARLVCERWRALKSELGRLQAATKEMHALAIAEGLQVPIEADTITGLRALWRLPVLHETARQAEEFARDAASLGVSRLYGASQPEFTGTESERAREQWTVAWSFARRLTTLPTHGRLSAAQMGKLRRLLQAARDRG